LQKKEITVAKNKILRFSENQTFPNLVQLDYDEIIKGVPLKGKWKSAFFKNNNPIVIELGCGKGEYTIGLAKRDPNKNYIGIDIKGARIWRGCKTSNEENMKNVGFIRTRIEHIEPIFDKEEIDEIWITFPDPQPKEFKAKKRLTSPRFLGIYKKFLSKEGVIHLKTDNDGLFEYTIEVIEEFNHKLIYLTHDLYNSDCEGAPVEIQTFYEKKYLELGQNINYVKFKMNA
jgi:tRNA (guanine-N7-)-methyltransferase